LDTLVKSRSTHPTFWRGFPAQLPV
jgi:hypothetical protein